MSGNDYGKIVLSNFTTALSVDDVIKTLRTQFEQSLLSIPVSVGDVEVMLSKSITGHGGHRYWFICPSCRSRVAKLYMQSPAIGCRHCIQVKYNSSRYKGMIESNPIQDQEIR